MVNTFNSHLNFSNWLQNYAIISEWFINYYDVSEGLMKTMLISVLVLLSVNLFASENELSTKGLKKLNTEEVKDLSDALMSANNGIHLYGVCSLNLIEFNDADVYINENSVSPLVVMLTKNRFLKINSDLTMTKLVSAFYGNYSLSRYNMGTIIKPVFKTINRITSLKDCNK